MGPPHPSADHDQTAASAGSTPHGGLRARAIPVLTQIHQAEDGASRLLLMVLYLAHLWADATIANSDFSRSIAERARRSLARRTRVIYNGVAGPVSTTPARMTLEGLPVRLAYVGRRSPRTDRRAGA